MRLDWTEFDKFSREFDVIIGSDVVYFGCPVKAYIVIPDRKNYADLFVREVEKTIFDT
jgi:hypothetical protein